MKKTIIVFFGILVLSGFFQGCSKKPDPQVVAAYKTFMDFFIVQDYTSALPLTTGTATDMVEPKTKRKIMGRVIQLKPGGFGKVEASKVKIIETATVGEQINLNLVYSASISWEGSTANPMSPGSWKAYTQKITMEKDADAWKVADFSGDGFEDI